MSEIVWWRNIPGYGGWYQINEHGEVRSWRMKGAGVDRAKQPTILRGFMKNGDRRVNLVDETGKEHCYTVRRLLHDVGYQTEPDRVKRRPVVKVDEHGNVLERYPSVRAAGKANYVSTNQIIYYCNGRNKNLFDGYCTFRYAEDFVQP